MEVGCVSLELDDGQGGGGMLGVHHSLVLEEDHSRAAVHHLRLHEEL